MTRRYLESVTAFGGPAWINIASRINPPPTPEKKARINVPTKSYFF
jgi:hypothetical protein